MLVLILDNSDLLGYEISKVLVERNKDIVIDFLAETINDERYIHGNIRYISGDRRKATVFKGLKKYYDVVIDLSTSLKNDIEMIFNEIKFEKYILKSSFQVYNFAQKNTLLNEDIVNIDYYSNALNMYLSPRYNEKEIYSREKLKCEFELIERSEKEKNHYVILRPSKIYSYNDQFCDLNWVVKRLNNKCPIIFKSSDIVKNNMFNPIYIKDLAKVVSKVVSDNSTNNNIFNIAQDELINLLDIIECLAKINATKFEYYILEDEHFTSAELKGYKIPIPDGKIVSNEKLKRYIDFRPQNINIWLPEINKQLALKDNINTENYLNEKLYIKKYCLIRQKLNNIKII